MQFRHRSVSQLQNGEMFASAKAYTSTPNADGSVDIYFGPGGPQGEEKNWIHTIPGKVWFPWIRFYNTGQSFFDQSWKRTMSSR